MSKINSTLLNDTLQLVQLARETALTQGKEAQAQKLSPVVSQMRKIVTSSREPQANTAPSGIMAQGDFRSLLEAAQKSTNSQKTAELSSSMDRNRMVEAMSAGNMSDVDIARQMGMTRDEVRLILSVSQKSKLSGEV